MTRDRPQAAQLSDDIPNYKAHNGKFHVETADRQDRDAVRSLVATAGMTRSLYA
jgi:hypothetical protein